MSCQFSHQIPPKVTVMKCSKHLSLPASRLLNTLKSWLDPQKASDWFGSSLSQLISSRSSAWPEQTFLSITERSPLICSFHSCGLAFHFTILSKPVENGRSSAFHHACLLLQQLLKYESSASNYLFTTLATSM